MDRSLFKLRRKSHIDAGEIYFWTATINNWQHLLKKDKYKDVIIDSLQWLTDKRKIDVFAFVVMPNHVHFIWRANQANGKESPHASFLKYTAHNFKKMLRIEGNKKLELYKVTATNKEYEFWQRDPVAIRLFSRKVALQKLNYIHNNPLKAHWNLARNPCDYKYSSASYYEFAEKNFSFLKNLFDAI